MITSKQMKAARLFLDWEQRDLAARAGVALSTVQRMEKLGMERSGGGNGVKVQRALEAGGVVFTPAGEGRGAGLYPRDPLPAADSD